jgi:prolyl 4-hydroxylase
MQELDDDLFASTLDRRGHLRFTIDDVLAPAECAALVARLEALGPAPAPITTARGFVHDKRHRDNDRVMFDDRELAALLFARTRARLPQELEGHVLHGCNERLRGYRYRPGQRFAPHYDGSFVRDASERSLLTFILYLNDAFTGGETAFLDDVVVPRRGRVLIFTHAQLHEGREVKSGTKYALRSDVMYRLKRE